MDEKHTYSAKDIEVLEGLEPVRRRPGMYIGGTDERALHHLASEILDNAMDEAVAKFARKIHMHFMADGSLRIMDDGRGIPTDPHPKFPDRSALEIVLTTLHSGGKFQGKAYETSGGLHGVGLSVVNALSDRLSITVYRSGQAFSQSYSRGHPLSPLSPAPAEPVKRGTVIEFHPDSDIFGDQTMKATTLYALARSKAFLFKGVKIHWSCDADAPGRHDGTPLSETIHFPSGIKDYLDTLMDNQDYMGIYYGEGDLADGYGRAEWALAWAPTGDAPCLSYCNTIPTPLGGTHETGLRNGLLKSIRDFCDRLYPKKSSAITTDDVMGTVGVVLSVFLKNPHFQGQTKEKLVSPEATRLIETLIKNHLDHWLIANKETATSVVDEIIQRCDERLAKKMAKETPRQSATRRLRLPGKLADCTRTDPKGTELFIVEGDSAGGSAKKARNRDTQAILPLRGKILNVASNTSDKLAANQELRDLALALGCGTGPACDPKNLRYERIIIMTDADVDGSHIASLLMTFFYHAMAPILASGHVFLAQPPLYRLSQGATVHYAHNDAEKDRLLKTVFKGKQNVDITRFKGLGEMQANHLRETTMDPTKRSLLRVTIDRGAQEATFVDNLMGKKPEARFAFITERAAYGVALDV